MSGARLPAMMLGGEIAVPDDHGVTHIDALSEQADPVGTVKFRLAGKGLRSRLDPLRSGPSRAGFLPVRPELVAQVKYFGYRSRSDDERRC